MKYYINYNINGGSKKNTNLKEMCQNLEYKYKQDYSNVKLASSDISTKGCIFIITNNNNSKKVIKIMTNNDYYYFYQTYKKLVEKFGQNYVNSIHPIIYKINKIENNLKEKFIWNILEKE